MRCLVTSVRRRVSAEQGRGEESAVLQYYIIKIRKRKSEP